MSLRMELGFPEGSGITTADSSGVGNNCTVGGGGWTTGHTGSGYAPTGTDEVTFPALGAAGGNVFSVMGWVRRTSAPGSGTVVCDIGTSAGTRWALQSNGSITALSGRTTGVIPDQTWTHVAFVADATTARTCYVNGVQVDQDTGSQSFLSASATYHLTSNATAWLQWDDFRVFDHALTLAEVQTYMDDTVGGGGGQSIDADPSTLTLVGQTPTATGAGAATTTADTVAVALSGQTPALAGTGPVVIAADTAVLSLTGQTPTAAGSGTPTLAADPAELTLTGQTPTLATAGGPITIPVDTAVLSLTGQTPAPTGTGATSVSADPGVLLLTGQTPGTTVHTVIPVDTATLVLAGLTATAIATGTAQLAVDPAALILEPQTPPTAGTGTAVLAADVAALQLVGVQALLFSGEIPTPVAPSERTRTVAAETRTLVVSVESRRLIIAATSRTVIAEPEE